jgi:hypothetical protein
MGAPTKFCQPGLLSRRNLMSAAKPTLKQISWRAVQDPRLASPRHEIWGTPQCDAAFADLERSADAGQPLQTLTRAGQPPLRPPLCGSERDRLRTFSRKRYRSAG